MKNEMNIAELREAIELKRAEIHKTIDNAIANGQKQSSDNIIKISQELDLLINRYNKLNAVADSTKKDINLSEKRW